MRHTMMGLLLTLLLGLSTACGAPPVTPMDQAAALPAPNTPAVTPAEQTAATAYPAPNAAYLAPVVSAPFPLVAEATTVPDAVIDLTIGTHRLTAEVVATPEKRAGGLMFRDTMPDDHGMLFVFPGPYSGSFWMRNTRIPLSIAFIDENRRILNILDMEPLDETTQHSPNGAAFYALEVNQGWFAARDIQPGDIVAFELPAGMAIR